MLRSRLKVILFVTALLALAMPTLPVLADCTVTTNPYNGGDWNCTGNTVGVINGTPRSDNITNHGTVTGYIWSAGFSRSTGQQDTITNNGVVGDHQPNPETNDDDDGLWGGAGNDTIINNGLVIGGPAGAIFGDGSEAYSPDQDYIVNNGTADGDVADDFQSRGHDTIIINGTVNGSVYGDISPGYASYGPSGGGNDLVIIRDNARISGIIDGNPGTDTLRFELTAQSQLEYDTLMAALATASPASGSLNFRDRTFTWQNFESLQSQINWLTTATPTATSTAGMPVVNIVLPSVDGTLVSTAEHTRFQAVAYDANLGTVDGAGIQRVAFEIYTPTNALAYSSTDTTAAYCAFGGNGPCNFSNVQGAALYGTYTLRARAQTTGGTWSDWVYRTFVIGSPSTATPTFTPSHTPVTPTATYTPSPTVTTDEPTATFTPSLTPSNTPTPVTPTATNIPVVPVVTIVVPAADGSYVSTVEDTRFQAVAYNPSVGTADGAGIQQVAFEIYAPNNARVYSGSDTTAAYCTFGGNGPCNVTGLTGSAPNGTYILRARAQTTGGVWTAWVSRTFIIGTPPPTSTLVPTHTPVTPTLTYTPSPEPSYTPTDVPVESPVPTETATDVPTDTPVESPTPTEASNDVPTATATDIPPEEPTATPTDSTSTVPTPTGTPKARGAVATALPPAVPQFYAFGDGRLNKFDIAAPVAVYCYKNGVVGWHITDSSNGIFGFYADAAQIANALRQAVSTNQHVMITEGMGHSLWALKSNELQVHSANYDFVFAANSCAR